MPSYQEVFGEVSEELLGDKGKHKQVWVVWVAAASQSGPHPGSADGWGLSIEAQRVYCQLLLHAFYLEFFLRPLIHRPPAANDGRAAGLVLDYGRIDSKRAELGWIGLSSPHHCSHPAGATFRE